MKLINIAFSLVLFAIIAGVIFLLPNKFTSETLHTSSNIQVHFQPYTDPVEIQSQPAIAIVPHHLVPSDLIHQTLARVARYAQTHSAPVDRIVVLAPNHFEQGIGTILTSRASWKTQQGVVTSDTALIDDAISHRLAREDFGTLEHEHGIFNEMVFIKQLFPDARIAPFIIRGELTHADRKQFAQFLHQQLGPHDLVIVSADFTHYVSESVMKLHDVGALSALIAADPTGANKIDVDTPASIEIAMHYAALRGAQQFKLTRRTSSVEYLKHDQPPDTTSYVSGVYIAGSVGAQPQQHAVVYVPTAMRAAPSLKLLTHGFQNVITESTATTREAAHALVRRGAQLVAAPRVETEISAEVYNGALIVYEPAVAIGMHVVEGKTTYYVYPLEQTSQREWQLAPFPRNRELLRAFSAAMDATIEQRAAIELEHGLSL